MSPEFKKWCQVEMKKLTGKTDLTLVNFLMAVQDEEQVREYIQKYLGSNDGYEEFANKFLAQRSFEDDMKQASKKKKNSSSGNFTHLGSSKESSNKVNKRTRRRKK